MIKDNLNKGPLPTVPNDTDDPPRFGQIIETTKDAFVIELRKFFNRANISNSLLEELPTIRKYDISTKSREGSLETAIKLTRKYPDVNENLPQIAVLGSTGRNFPMAIGTKFVASVHPKPSVTSGNTEPFTLAVDQILIFRTITPQKEERTTTIIFRESRFANIAQATAQEIVNEINFQSLFARARVGSNGEVIIGYGGVLTQSVTGDIVIGNGTDTGTAATALGFTLNQQTLFTSVLPFNRYHHSAYIDVALEVLAEDENIRTEITDLLWTFFTFTLDDQDFSFHGRSSFNDTISNETYQVIIKPDPSIAGEQEIPRPNDEVDKVYVNRINIPVTTIQYIDKAVVAVGSSSPLYLDASNATFDDTIPAKN